jgi:hypothetical protein
MRSTGFTIFILLLIAAASVILAGVLSLRLSLAGTLGDCFTGACGYTTVFIAWPGLTLSFFAIGAYLYLKSAPKP